MGTIRATTLEWGEPMAKGDARSTRRAQRIRSAQTLPRLEGPDRSQVIPMWTIADMTGPAKFAKMLAVVVLAAAFGACRDGRANAAIQATYDNTGHLQMLAFDSNRNGKPDTWSHMEGSRIARIDIDADEDGAIDRWEYYDSNQQLAKVGTARKRDGKVSRSEFYEGGLLARAEEDTDGNGLVDKWETYANGAMAAVAFDTEGAGHPTRRIQYEVASK